jgi:quinoprotein glucose dehydrogenase
MPEGKKNAGNAGSGGPIATAGGLVFIAATGDSRLRAFDSKTGKELWAMLSENGMTATPMACQGNNGKQYVAITAAGGSAATQSLNAYSLP